MSYRAFVGIDVSKKTFDCCVLIPGRAGRYEKRFANTDTGVQHFTTWLTTHTKIDPSAWLICMEHTGVYTLPLITGLSKAKLRFVVESPLRLKRSMGIVRMKSDKADARSIALYAHNHQSQLRLYRFHGQAWLKLCNLLRYREKLVKTKAQFSTVYTELTAFTEQAVHAEVAQDSAQLIQELELRIKRVNQQLKQAIKQDKALEKNFNLLLSIKGVGPITAYNMLITTRNFTAFDTPRAFACYAGTAPFEYSSGTSIKKRNRVSQIANKHIKALLYEVAWTAVIWDPQLKAYYNRMLEKGKPKLLIINNVKNKIIARMFAVIQRQTPYVIFAH